MGNPFGRSRRRREAQRLALIGGAPLDLDDTRLRRTSARGWGPWTPAVLHLGPPDGGAAAWHVEDPVAVGLPALHGPVDARFSEVEEVWTRPVRFRTEAFWGMDAEIVVLRTERATTELACDPALAPLVADRLRRLLDLPGPEGG